MWFFRTRIIIWLTILALSLAGCQRSPVVDGGEQDETGVPSALVKIHIGSSGYYKLGDKEFKAAGLKLESIDLETTRLYGNGREQPFWTDGEGIGFYAFSITNRYSNENIYWLAIGGAALPGGEMCSQIGVDASVQPDPVPIQLPVGAVTGITRIEKDQLYQPLVLDGDHWFASSVISPQSIRMDFNLVDLAPGTGTAHLRLSVWSNTESTVSPDHHLGIQINGQKIAEEAWEGTGWHTIQAEFSSDWLAVEDNQVEILAVGDPQVTVDIYHIDVLQVTYPRLPQAQEGTLDFWQPDGAIRLGGFSGPIQVLDITDENQVLRVAKDHPNDELFQGEAGRHYLAVDLEGTLQPLRVTNANLLPDLRGAENSAEYLAIGPEDLLEPLQPLLDWRTQQGLEALGVPLQAVYDQFSCGIPVPQAIQAFMKYAVQNWQDKPRFLLLVGDASYDPKGYIASPENNRLPTFLVNTVYGGETASDVDFVQLNDDPWPDLPVGRIPASSAEQVGVVVEKILTYEQSQSSPAQLLAIADGQEESFRRDAQAFLDLFPSLYARELFAPQAGAQGANLQILDYLGQSNLLVAYFGHGSVNMWGKDRLFTTEDVASMVSPDQLPVVINLTCLTGLFTHPKVESLAEAMLWHPQGPVAVLAPSSLTLPTDQSFLSHPFARAFVDNPDMTLGELHLAARRQVNLDSPGALDVMQTFMLFGDPALKLAMPAP